MTLDRATPRPRESFDVEIAVERETQLPRVNGRAAVVQAVKEYPLLERRKRVEVFDLAWHKIEGVVCVSLAAITDDCPQRFHKTLGETFYRPVPVDPWTINPLAL